MGTFRYYVNSSTYYRDYDEFFNAAWWAKPANTFDDNQVCKKETFRRDADYCWLYYD